MITVATRSLLLSPPSSIKLHPHLRPLLNQSSALSITSQFPSRGPANPGLPPPTDRSFSTRLQFVTTPLFPTPSPHRTMSTSTSSSPRFTNRLAREKSPYLLQHAHNPVNWYPWGEEAFAKAERENKLIFLSVGYSTCHWCHVMEHESFEDEETARIMNELYVNVKVDREERPTVDKMYMTFIQATAGRGGWPMSVWLNPQLQPFYGGTYYPRDDGRHGPGFKSILRHMSRAWTTEREKVLESGKEVMEVLEKAEKSPPLSSRNTSMITSSFSLSTASQLATHYIDMHDPTWGGFGSAPKFPTPPIMYFLLDFCARCDALPKPEDVANLPVKELRAVADKCSVNLEKKGLTEKQEIVEAVKEGLEEMHEKKEMAKSVTLDTLKNIAAGGIHDHVGNGFHRYSVDKEWHVPHFEKMLYDQAQLLDLYLTATVLDYTSPPTDPSARPAFLPTDPAFHPSAVARDIVTYVSRDLQHPDGGFYCGEDADSLPSAGPADAAVKKEGAFCVWEAEEFNKVVGEEYAEMLRWFFDVRPTGNVPKSVDHQGELKGQNVLRVLRTPAMVLEKFGDKLNLGTISQITDIIADAKRKLWEVRLGRPKPHKDDKILVAWNGLMIASLARAHCVLAPLDAERSEFLDLATKAAEFIRARLSDDSGKLISRVYREGPGTAPAVADDYAFLVRGLLELYQAGGDVSWLEWAVQLQHVMDEKFWDPVAGGYFSGAKEAEGGRGQAEGGGLLRMKEDYDGAEPSPNSVAAHNLVRLAALAPGADGGPYLQRARETAMSGLEKLLRYPQTMPFMVTALMDAGDGLKEYIYHGDRSSNIRKLLHRNRCSTYTTITVADSRLSRLHPEAARIAEQATERERDGDLYARAKDGSWERVEWKEGGTLVLRL
ncbi:hypothetical protein M427DRAFT_110456 [Gonapodya prolifera JEL478]|uniref:Spermatogenesis-associated protein 20-like TRX domain-containing protein n=1 Tax=Gonapodya prolifera (strain JEL478) TaxID=1344416 RepID=A0A139ALG0_GONPJ|nr:hypothetical protein M427DRAFT_110456 [Gonapodya prolifera JEL478]|eukprot:KXS17333.1 hypothetical protein M427DRAFT_110456 [Gonapodya prolifera JEL478]